MATKTATTVQQLNNLSAQFETAYQSLSDKYNSLADSTAAATTTANVNNQQAQAVVAQAQDTTVSATNTKNFAIAGIAVVLLIAIIFFFKK